MAKEYIGDSVYADIDEHDQIVLTTEDGVRVTNTIYLESSVFKELVRFAMKAGLDVPGLRIER